MENPPFLIGARPGHYDTEAALVHVTTSGANKHRLILYINFDERCVPANPTVEVINEPTRGEMTIGRTVVKGLMPKLKWPADDPRGACEIRNTPSTIIDYQPAAGFVGRDIAVVNIKDKGHTWHMAFFIDVQSR
jgi:hypothetical protein